MTVLESLNIEVNNQVISEKSLIQVGLDSTSIYSLENSPTVELAKAYAFKSIITQPDYSEDGLAVEYDRKYLVMEANRIFKINGLEDEMIGQSTPVINNKTGLW